MPVEYDAPYNTVLVHWVGPGGHIWNLLIKEDYRKVVRNWEITEVSAYGSAVRATFEDDCMVGEWDGEIIEWDKDEGRFVFQFKVGDVLICREFRPKKKAARCR